MTVDKNKSETPNADEIRDFLVNCGVLIGTYLDNKGKAKKLGYSIQKIVKTLYHRHNIERDELKSIIYSMFKSRNRHLKYDPELSSLESYVAWFVYYSLLTILNACKQSEIILLSELKCEDSIKKQGISTNFMERRGVEGLVNFETPEDLLLWKELLLETYTFFGKHDWRVLVGLNDRKTEAQRLGIEYDIYRKRLLRRCAVFRIYLKNIGYFD